MKPDKVYMHGWVRGCADQHMGIQEGFPEEARPDVWVRGYEQGKKDYQTRNDSFMAPDGIDFSGFDSDEL